MIKDLLKNQSRLFWVLHLGGWLAWALFAKYGFTVLTLEKVPPHYFMYVMAISTIGMLLSIAVPPQECPEDRLDVCVINHRVREYAHVPQNGRGR